MAKKAKQPGRKCYPWDRWFANRTFRLTEGVNFNCQPHSMIVQIRNAAASRGKSVSVSVEDGSNGRVITVSVGEQAA